MQESYRKFVFSWVAPFHGNLQTCSNKSNFLPHPCSGLQSHFYDLLGIGGKVKKWIVNVTIRSETKIQIIERKKLTKEKFKHKSIALDSNLMVFMKFKDCGYKKRCVPFRKCKQMRYNSWSLQRGSDLKHIWLMPKCIVVRLACIHANT